MTLPANVRVNTLVPFPAQITGGAPITIGKTNGIWQVNYNPTTLGAQTPTQPQLITDFVTVYDSVAKTVFNMSLHDLVAAVTPLPNSLTQRLVTGGPVSILTTDRVINFNCTTPTTVNLPGYLTRGGSPITFKDVGGQATANNITIAPSGGELIDGMASAVLDTAYQSMTLLPAFDGTTTGWLMI